MRRKDGWSVYRIAKHLGRPYNTIFRRSSSAIQSVEKFWVKVANHTADSVQAAIQRVLEYFGSKANDVFKSITSDNGTEFSRLSELATQGISVYFTHPYSSWEKGTNECHNKLLRRFIPKGFSMARYSPEDIAYMADWANTLPRKKLGYRTPDELFDMELDRIYSL